MHVSGLAPSGEVSSAQRCYWTRPISLKIRPLHNSRSPANGNGLAVPCLMLRGMWMNMVGIEVGSRVVVSIEPGKLVLTLAVPADGAASRFFSRRMVLQSLGIRRRAGEAFDAA